MLADTLAATEPATAVQAAAAEAVDPDQQKLKPNLAAVSKLADDTQQPRQSGQAHDQEQDQGQTHGHGQHGEMGALEPTLGQLATIPVGQPGSETTTTRHLGGPCKVKSALFAGPAGCILLIRPCSSGLAHVKLVIELLLLLLPSARLMNQQACWSY